MNRLKIRTNIDDNERAIHKNEEMRLKTMRYNYYETEFSDLCSVHVCLFIF